MTCQDTYAANPENKGTRIIHSDRASLVTPGVRTSQQQEVFPALAGCRSNYRWSSLAGGPRCQTPRPSVEIPGWHSWGHDFSNKSFPEASLILALACQMKSKQALSFFENFLHFNMCFSCGKSRRWRGGGNLRQNLQLPLITHAAKFIRSQCPFERWHGIFHAQSSFSGGKQTFPLGFVCALVE